jgi:hypothetical protein
MYPPSQAAVDHPSRRFVSPSSAAPTAPPPGAAFLASTGCHRFRLDRHEPRRLAHNAPSNGPGADDDADDDVEHCLRPGISPVQGAREALAGLAAVVATPPPLSTPVQAAEPLHGPRTSTSPMKEIPQPATMQVVRFLHPWCEGPYPAESTIDPIRKCCRR